MTSSRTSERGALGWSRSVLRSLRDRAPYGRVYLLAAGKQATTESCHDVAIWWGGGLPYLCLMIGKVETLKYCEFSAPTY